MQSTKAPWDIPGRVNVQCLVHFLQEAKAFFVPAGDNEGTPISDQRIPFVWDCSLIQFKTIKMLHFEYTLGFLKACLQMFHHRIRTLSVGNESWGKARLQLRYQQKSQHVDKKRTDMYIVHGKRSNVWGCNKTSVFIYKSRRCTFVSAHRYHSNPSRLFQRICCIVGDCMFVTRLMTVLAAVYDLHVGFTYFRLAVLVALPT